MYLVRIRILYFVEMTSTKAHENSKQSVKELSNHSDVLTQRRSTHTGYVNRTYHWGYSKATTQTAGSGFLPEVDWSTISVCRRNLKTRLEISSEKSKTTWRCRLVSITVLYVYCIIMCISCWYRTVHNLMIQMPCDKQKIKQKTEIKMWSRRMLHGTSTQINLLMSIAIYGGHCKTHCVTVHSVVRKHLEIDLVNVLNLY